MGLQTPQAMERDELMQHRREGGIWLRSLREQAGLSQRELAAAVGADYYSFVSQLESGKGRVPVAQVELWAKALRVPRSFFARGLLRYYDPITYDMLFSDEEAALRGEIVSASEPESAGGETPGRSVPAPRLLEVPKPANQPPTPDPKQPVDEDLRARINRLEAILMMRGANS